MFVVSVLQAASPLVHTNDKYQSQQVGNGSHSQTHHIDNNRAISTPIQQHSYHHNYVDIEEDPDLIELISQPTYDQQLEQYRQEHLFRMTGNGLFSNNSGVH
jgi:hypothetical protein